MWGKEVRGRHSGDLSVCNLTRKESSGNCLQHIRDEIKLKILGENCERRTVSSVWLQTFNTGIFF